MVDATGLCLKFAELREEARKKVPAAHFKYVDSGAGDGLTLRNNREAWRRIKLVPRVLTGQSGPADTSCTLFGHKLAAPLVIAPMALHSLMHEEGESATARAAEKCGIPLCLSMVASRDMEDVHDSGFRPVLFQQLYMPRDEGAMERVLKEWYRQGCRCVVFTVDTVTSGLSKDSESFVRGEINKRAAVMLKENYGLKPHSAGPQPIRQSTHRNVWSVVAAIKSVVDVKVVLKGVLSAADADLAVEHGADGIIVSNHGGRQVDTAVTAPDVLPDIAKAVDGRIPVLADGGIQRATDIVKALAMGASAVLIGRPILYALAAGGAEKVKEVLEDLKQDLAANLANCGCSCIGDVNPSLLYTL